MRTIKVHLGIGFPMAQHHDEIEVEDDATPEQIDQITTDWANNYIETWWEEND